MMDADFCDDLMGVPAPFFSGMYVDTTRPVTSADSVSVVYPVVYNFQDVGVLDIEKVARIRSDSTP